MVLKTDLYQGDCLEVMDSLIEQGVKVDAVITDIPYGTTACAWDVVIPFKEMWGKLDGISRDDTPIVLFGSEPFSSMLRCSNIKHFKYDWVWEKQKASNFLGVKYAPFKFHENISVFSKGVCKYNPQRYKVLEFSEIEKMDKHRLKSLFESREYDRYGTVDRRKTVRDPVTNKSEVGIEIKRTRYVDDGYRYPKSVLKFNKDGRTVHPTQKPILLMEYLVKTYSDKGDTVLDFTMGSGTTGVACKRLGRNFIGIEINPEYFEIAKKRIEDTQEVCEWF